MIFKFFIYISFFSAVAPRGLNQSNPRPVSKLLDEPLSSISDTASLSTNIERPPTLRLKSDGQAMIEEAVSRSHDCHMIQWSH